MNEKVSRGASGLAEVSGGAVAGVVAVAYAMSYAALLLPGRLHELLPMGMALALVSGAIGAAWLAWRSQLPFAIAGPDGNTSSILAAMATTAAAAPLAALQSNVLWLLVVATLVCGALFLVLGFGRLGLAVRYVPYPVIGGFLASTGLLIVLGALRVAAPPTQEWWSASVFASAAFAAVLLAVLRRARHPLVLPALLLAGCVAVLAGLHAAGIGPQEARARGWLFGLAETPRWITPFTAPTAGVDWAWIADQWIDMLAVAVVAVITVLLGASGLEVRSRRDISLDREMREHGWLNIACACLGGYLSLVSVGRSAVLLDGGVRTRAGGFVCAAVCMAALAGASWLLAGIPKVVLAGFLLYLGLSILKEWVIDARRHVGRFDWFLIVAVLATTAIIGFTVAVFAGIVISCLNFALNYSRVGIVQHDLDGSSVRSTVQRPSAHRAVLGREGSRIRVLVLRGAIFFGTASALLERLRPFLQASEGDRAPRALVLDFSQTGGADSSAEFTFAKIAQLADDGQVSIVVCGLGDGARHAVAMAMPRAFVAGTLDEALDHAEDLLLRARGEDPHAATEPIEPWLSRELGGPEHARAVQPLLRRRDVPAGEVLMQEGESEATLFLVEAGRLRVTVSGLAEGRRLATLMAGTIVGEMALYGDARRSATVTAESEAVVWALTREAVESLHATAPDTAMRVHAFVVRTLAERVRQANAAAAALQRGAEPPG